MSSKKNGAFRRKNPEEIMTERVKRDRYIFAFFSMLFVYIATSVIFPIVDLAEYISKGTGASVQELMRETLSYALMCSITVGAVIVLMALLRLWAINLNPQIRAKPLYQTGFYIVIIISALILILRIII